MDVVEPGAVSGFLKHLQGLQQSPKSIINRANGIKMMLCWVSSLLQGGYPGHPRGEVAREKRKYQDLQMAALAEVDILVRALRGAGLAIDSKKMSWEQAIAAGRAVGDTDLRVAIERNMRDMNALMGQDHDQTNLMK